MRDFIEISQPFEAIAPQLVQDAQWLDPLAEDAVEEALTALGALRPGQSVGTGIAPVTVRCTRGPVQLRSEGVAIPLRWDTNPPPFVLPTLDGDLEIVPLGQHRSLVAFNATTPLSPDHDEWVARRVVETGVRAFLRQLAARLDAPVPAVADSSDFRP